MYEEDNNYKFVFLDVLLTRTNLSNVMNISFH